MTIASLIVDVAANTVKLQQDVEQINGQLSKVESLAGAVGKALAAAFTVTAVIGAAREFINYADTLVNVSEKTKFTTDMVQGLTLAFEPHGIAIEAVASANEKLAKNLVSGDKSTVAALGKMGLSVDALLRMSPDQLFLAVADAVGKIQNPTEQAYVAMTVFGKGGQELLAGLDGHLGDSIQHFKDLGLIISEKTVKAADDFGDQLLLMGKQLLGIVATIVGPLLPALSGIGSILMWIGNDIIGPVFNVAIKSVLTVLGIFWEGLSDLLSTLVALGTHIPIVGTHLGFLKDASDWLAKSSANTTDYLKHLWDNTDRVGESAKRTAPAVTGLGQAAGKAADDHKKLVERLYDLEHGVPSATERVQSLTAAVKGLGQAAAPAMSAVMVTFNALLEQLKQIEAHTPPATIKTLSLADALEQVGTHTTVFITGAHDIATGLGTLVPPAVSAEAALKHLHDTMGNKTPWQTFKDIAKSTLDGLNDIFQRAFEGGGGVGGAISSLATNLTKGLLNMIPGIGPTLGKFAGAIFSGIKKLFGGGPSDDELQGRGLVSNFESQLSLGLNIQEKMEAQGDSWKRTVIGIRDAYAAMGIPEAIALRDTQLLWESSKGGPDRANAVIQMIQAKMEGWWWKDPADALASGGIVGNSSVQRFAGGGPVGTDTVPAWLTPGEMVLNAGQQRAVSALMRGGGRGGGVSIGTINVQAAGHFADTPQGRRELADMTAKAIEQQMRLRGRVRAA